MKEKVVIVVQARNKSTRLPFKVLKDIGGRPLLSFLIERLQRCKEVNEIVIATTLNKEDDSIASLAKDKGLLTVRGSQENVLSRFILASKKSKADILVRITGDCPLMDPLLLDNAVKLFKYNKFDYISNSNPPSFPDGLDIEVFSRETLIKAHKFANNSFQKEHVTPWMRESNEIVKFNIKYSIDYSNLRWTVDEPEDLEVIRNVVNHFNNISSFSWNEVIELNNSQPSLFFSNNIFKRNEGSQMSSGQKLWKRAKRVIPGGNMLLSKRPEMYLPNSWPTYFSKSIGCSIWDLDSRHFLDLGLTSIGTNILGYGYPKVDKAVSETIKKGNMTSLNCPEEVFLAEKLVELHPWADMVRFARTGGEANAIAIRIARAASGRDKVAICGYHGWHDWYLASNLNNNDKLKNHLLPGLEPNGVPSNLQETTFPFTYNNLEELKKIISFHKLAAVKMEVERTTPPAKGFLEGVRKLCDENGIILIFDECTSGFRETNGGLHKKYKINPDMAIFGKALGNGYSITSVIGKRAIMEAAQSTFISSTFWTERIGPTAALATLKAMEEEKSWQQITKSGKYIKNLWQKISDMNKVKIIQMGIPALSVYQFDSKDNLKYKTLISQEMLKIGYLATTGIYVSISHTDEILEKYAENLNKIFSMIAKCEKGSENIDHLIEGEVCHNGFKRLN